METLSHDLAGELSKHLNKSDLAHLMQTSNSTSNQFSEAMKASRKQKMLDLYNNISYEPLKNYLTPWIGKEISPISGIPFLFQHYDLLDEIVQVKKMIANTKSDNLLVTNVNLKDKDIEDLIDACNRHATTRYFGITCLGLNKNIKDINRPYQLVLSGNLFNIRIALTEQDTYIFFAIFLASNPHLYIRPRFYT